MASFKIYQDAEKENPQNLGGIGGATAAGILRDRKTVGVGISGKNITGQAQTRSNFSVLNMNANVAGGGGFAGVRTGGSTKLALHITGNTKLNKDGSNVQLKDNNANANKDLKLPITKTKCTTKTTSTKVSASTATNTSTNSATNTATTTTTTVSAASKSATITIDQTKSLEHEDISILTQLEFERQHQNHHITVENDKDYGGIINDKIITTPMSVSDMFSPMSVDRSTLSSFEEDSVDKENQPDLLQHLQKNLNHDDSCTLNISHDEIVSSPVQQQQKEQQSVKNLAPRNDRQRFFEVVEYQDDILEYFREGEKKHRPKPNYMRRQPDINHSMRTILVDWLVEVSEEYNLDTETLYLSISYIDRFLSHMSVVRSKLQLVGTAAMYIAAKYEEIYPPDVNEFVFITDDTYTKAQVLRMEQLILKILSFDLCTPTPYVFVNTYAVLTDMTNDLKFLAMYICELSLLEADPYLRYVPSIISAASLALARYILDYNIWSAHLEEVTTYRLEDLKEVFLHLCNTHKVATTLAQQAIQEKYKTKKYGEVSTLKPVEMTPEKYDVITSNYNETSAAELARLEREQADATANNENVRRMISLMFN